MKYIAVLIGDELGLLVLEDVIKSYGDFEIKALVVSEGREEAIRIGKGISERRGCVLMIQPKSQSEEYSKFIHDIALIHPDLGICYSYDRILKKEFLDVFHGKIYNVHGALLPRYRGTNVLNWVLINDEKKTGVTIHIMVPQLDAGAIALQKEIEIGECDTAVTLREKINAVAIELLHIFFSRFLSGSIDVIEQDEEEATIVRRRKPEDGFFTWDQDARNIYNIIRALVAPWPGAWYMKDGKKYVIDQFVSYERVKEMKREMEDGGKYNDMCHTSA